MSKACWALALVVVALGYSSCGLFQRRSAGNKAADSAGLAQSPALAQRDTFVLNRLGPLGPMPDTLNNSTGKPGEVVPEVSPLLHALLPYSVPGKDWQTFSSSAEASFEAAAASHDFKAHIRMERGKNIWISATALLNFEVARLLITPDSVWLLNRLTRSVFALPFDKMDELLPLKTDFESLQSLILGGPLRMQQAPNLAKDTSGSLLLGYANEGQIQMLLFSKRDTSLQEQYLSAQGSSMTCSYGDPGLQQGHAFPATRQLRMVNQGALYLLKLNFNQVTFDKPVEFPFSIPKSYQRK